MLDTPPPLSELFTRRQFAKRHPHLFSDNRIAWAYRNRDQNGLKAAAAVFETKGGELWIHEPRFLQWWLGLAGRAKPRALRRRGSRAS